MIGPKRPAESTNWELWTNGVNCKELRTSTPSGFVAKVVMNEIEPPQLVTIARQPGGNHATVISSRDASRFAGSASGFYRYRYQAYGQDHPFDISKVTERLTELAPVNPVADKVLSFLIRTGDADLSVSPASQGPAPSVDINRIPWTTGLDW